MGLASWMDAIWVAYWKYTLSMFLGTVGKSKEIGPAVPKGTENGLLTNSYPHLGA